MPYKYRIQVLIAFFLIFSTTTVNLFGYTGCRDGWSSPSVGKRGACSHHGGVTSNKGFLILLSGGLTFGLFIFINSRYRVYYNLVVSSKLPPHPLEEKLNEKVNFYCYPLPKLKAKSRRSFICYACKNEFRGGSFYWHLNKSKRRIKYCESCSHYLPEINAEIEHKQQLHLESRKKIAEEINAYYEKHSKAILS